MKIWRTMLAALSLGALAVGAAPALAKDHGNGHGRHDERHDGRHGDNHDRGRDRHYARDHHDDRNWGRDRDRRYAHGRHDRWDDRRHGHRAVYGYDWNRPDPRYRGYYAERYYRGGYDPIRMNRHMRIYRGYDDRYYCRRDDGTTGLIIGAALGAMLGNQLERGQSNLAATLIGGGVGGLLGREIDRGDLVCR